MKVSAMNTTTNNALSRHNFPKPVRDFLNLAVSLDVIDAVELMVLGSEHGTDWRSMGEDLLDAAHVARHHSAGQDRQSQLCEAWDRLLADDAT